MSTLGNLTLTATSSLMSSGLGLALDTLQSRIANNGRDTKCRFYYSSGGGSLLQVAVKKLAGGIINELKDEVVNQFNSLLNPKKQVDIYGQEWVDSELKAQEQEEKKYGKMSVGENTVLALDDWGNVCVDSLMLGMPIEKPIKITQNYPQYKANGDGTVDSSMATNTFSSNMLVWYDTTALVSVNSDKNLVITQVQGRDYSRKELVSNGDVKFSVSGHISSGRPDIYPTEEVKKFIQVMKYKGVIEVNNQILDQFNINRILITDFSLPSHEGFKAIQDYSFNAIGLQPEAELTPSDDTLTIINQRIFNNNKTESNAWKDMLNGQLDALKSMATGLVDQGLGLATGLLENAL